MNWQDRFEVDEEVRAPRGTFWQEFWGLVAHIVFGIIVIAWVFANISGCARFITGL